eukprot:gene9669-6766_t
MSLSLGRTGAECERSEFLLLYLSTDIPPVKKKRKPSIQTGCRNSHLSISSFAFSQEDRRIAKAIASFLAVWCDALEVVWEQTQLYFRAAEIKKAKCPRTAPLSAAIFFYQ